MHLRFQKWDESAQYGFNIGGISLFGPRPIQKKIAIMRASFSLTMSWEVYGVFFLNTSHQLKWIVRR